MLKILVRDKKYIVSGCRRGVENIWKPSLWWIILENRDTNNNILAGRLILGLNGWETIAHVNFTMTSKSIEGPRGREKYLWKPIASIMQFINSHVSIGSPLVTKKGCKSTVHRISCKGNIVEALPFIYKNVPSQQQKLHLNTRLAQHKYWHGPHFPHR